MKTFVYKYTDDKKLGDFIVKNKISDFENVLVQIFSGIVNKNFILNVRDNIKNFLPNASIIGATTDGEIFENNTFEKTLIISFSVFKKTKLRTFIVFGNDGTDSFGIGQKLAENLISKKSKVLISFLASLKANGEEFVNGIGSINSDIVLVGGLSGDNAEFNETFVFNENSITSDGSVGVILDSDNLIVDTKYSFDFVGVGKFLNIDYSQGNRVYRIDGMKAVDVYKKYLGDDVARNLPATGIEFPFLINRKGAKVARAVTAKFDDGSLQFAGNIETGDSVQFTFGNINMMSETALKVGNFFVDKPVETFFVYSCMARKRLMGESIKLEIEPLSNIASTSGFFTYGEFFHSKDGNHLLNETMTILSLSETENIKSDRISKKAVSDNVSNVNTMKALSNLINITTLELESANEKLNESVQKAIELRDFTNKVFDSQSDITIVSSKNKKKTIDANAAFFSYFHYENISEFVDKHGCICNLFIERNGFLGKYKDGLYWVDYILKNQGLSHKVMIEIDGKMVIFLIKIKELVILEDSLFIISLADITETENINLILEEKVKERTIELEKSNKKLVNLDQMKNDFIGIASHELRTPMTVIKNYASMLLDGGFGSINKDQFLFLSKILNNTDQLINLVNDILDINKLEAGKFIFKFEKVEVFNFTKEIRKDFLPLFEEKNISLTLKNELKGSDIVNVDKNRLFRVFNNLLGNALKFTDKGGKVKIIISDENSEFIKILVVDNGIGISQNKHDTIFDKFSQVDSHLQRSYNGTGLGLSIVKMIIDRMGGELGVESKLGKGSTFFFTLRKNK